MSYLPLIQAFMILQNTPGGKLRLPGLDVRSIAISNRSSKFDLSLMIYPEPAGLNFTWEYRTDLFDESTIERLAREYHSLLEAIVANPDQRLSELSLEGIHP